MTDTMTTPDTTKLDKIRGLLEKAESTDSPEEAEALTAKAMDWMERYRITEAMIADSKPRQDRGKLVEKAVDVGKGPYVNARIQLADAVARNNSVKLLISNGLRSKRILLCGYESDVERVEMLYTSLLVQATRAMNHPDTKADKPDCIHGTAFNRAFLLGFSDEIDLRLKEANIAASSDHEASAGDGRSVALVLADRAQDAEDFVFKRYGKVGKARSSAPAASYTGLTAGGMAGRRADIGTDRRVNGNRKELAS